MNDLISVILRTRPITKIDQARIRSVAIKVPNLLAWRARPAKRLGHKLVWVDAGLFAATMKVAMRVSATIRRRFHDPAADGSLFATVRADGPIQRFDTTEV